MGRPPPNLEDTHAVRSAGAVTLVVRRDWEGALPVEEMLVGAPIDAWGDPVEHDLHGRGAVHVLETPAGPIVAKALSRGGVVGAVLRRLYGDPWRCAREAVVAERLLARGCPTPVVVAARATRVFGPLHRLEIATRRLVGARDLLDVLKDASGPAAGSAAPAAPDGGGHAPTVPALARATGATLRRLHDAGLAHRDLQVKNLLVPPDLGADDLLAVIDLDRCALGPPLDASARERSLARFLRSLVKHGLLPGASGPAGATGAAGGPARDLRPAVAAFLRAYGRGGPSDPRTLLRHAVARLRRGLGTHERLWKARRPGV